MSKRKHPKICPVTKKTMFKTEEMANRIKMRIWSHDPSADITDLHVYTCKYCEKFHIGHLSYYKMALEQAESS